MSCSVLQCNWLFSSSYKSTKSERMERRFRTISLIFLLTAVVRAQRVGPAGNTCPDSCPDSVRPVCGTNGVAYKNECFLRRASCNSSSIQKNNDGPCASEESRDCQRSCSSSYQPVCATNGRTYGNSCKLSVAMCENPSIRQHFEGVCDVSSGSSGSTQQNSGNRTPSVGNVIIGQPVRPVSSPVINTPSPERSCPDNCAPGFRPVCGSDGQVYANDCTIRVAICKNPRLQKKNDGVCEKDCNIECSLEVSYVCGSDGRTYINDCELIVARCKDPAITKVRDGPCGNIRDSECVIEPCSPTVAPVCGSNGRSYRNICNLRNDVCNVPNLLKLHDGECIDQRCGESCPTVFEPVCGTDGVTYPNHCTLVNTACRTRTNILKQANGQCGPRNN
ncbi:hypothetical protein SK128_018732 [Halocaridina rubra]|uniref:Kazal-like domain-containing protein n=1 Tax=Halocaridina rubra TaxID=373956 RepID=A0AAN8X357_HALRR